MLLHVAPPSTESCHWTLGAGEPDAEAVNAALVPLAADTLAGLVRIATAMIAGEAALCTFKSAGAVVTDPLLLLKTARYSQPLWLGAAAKTRVSEVAPGIGAQRRPRSSETCQCTLGFGLPRAAAARLTVAPTATVAFDGSRVIWGAPGRAAATSMTVTGAALVRDPPPLAVRSKRNERSDAVRLRGSVTTVLTLPEPQAF